MRTPPYPLVASFCIACRRECWHTQDMSQSTVSCRCYKGRKFIHFFLKGKGFEVGEWKE